MKNKPALDYTRMLNFFSHSTNLGIIQLQSDYDTYNGRNLGINGKKAIHFANCSYIGLDVCESLKLGAIDATTRYGTLFSSSRLCVGLDLNEQLEGYLNQITSNHTLVTQSTTLGSISAIPIIVSPNDLIVLDHQVHTSVQNAVKLAESQGTAVGMVRHNNLTALEDIIQKNKNKYHKIWYMADGVYSMLGDVCPVEGLYELMERYSNFHCYVDDAHGISWIGEHGKGMVLHKRPLHAQMVLVMSLAKGFGCCGGVLVFPEAEPRHLIRCLGTSLIFSGPIPSPVLGACIASAKLHLSDEIYTRQNVLHALIKYFREKAYAYELPLVNHTFSPIFYFGAGGEGNAYYIVKQLLEAGFLTTICNYPVVPKKNAGIRVTLTTHNTFEDIENLLSTMAGIIDELESQGKLNKEKIYNDFKAMQVS